jgi:hypothetical protein
MWRHCGHGPGKGAFEDRSPRRRRHFGVTAEGPHHVVWLAAAVMTGLAVAIALSPLAFGCAERVSAERGGLLSGTARRDRALTLPRPIAAERGVADHRQALHGVSRRQRRARTRKPRAASSRRHSSEEAVVPSRRAGSPLGGAARGVSAEPGRRHSVSLALLRWTA